MRDQPRNFRLVAGRRRRQHDALDGQEALVDPAQGDLDRPRSLRQPRGQRVADLAEDALPNVEALGCPSFHANLSAPLRPRKPFDDMQRIVVTGTANVVGHSFDGPAKAQVERMLFRLADKSNYLEANGVEHRFPPAAPLPARPPFDNLPRHAIRRGMPRFPGTGPVALPGASSTIPSRITGCNRAPRRLRTGPLTTGFGCQDYKGFAARGSTWASIGRVTDSAATTNRRGWPSTTRRAGPAVVFSYDRLDLGIRAEYIEVLMSLKPGAGS